MKTNLLLTAALSLSLCSASTAQTLPAYLPTDGLVGWWPFNGNANDESGNSGVMSINNCQYAMDRNGQSESSIQTLGNNSSYLEIVSNPSINSISFTWSLWVKFSSNSSNGGGFNVNPGIMSRTPAGTTCNGATIFEAGSNAGAQNLVCSSIVENYGCGSSQTIGDNEWHHVAMIVNPGFYSQFYIDGTPQTSVFIPSYFTVPTDQNIRIGRPTDLFWKAYLGILDDIAIYNRALTPEEITALYTGEPVNPPAACNPLPSNLQNGLVGYWPFCGNANDESGNGNDGTVNGATLTVDRFGVANSAYDFDGVDDFVEIVNNILPSQTSFAINFWTKLENYQNIDFLNDRIEPTCFYKYRVSATNGKIKFWRYTNSSLETTEGDSIPVAQWVMITSVYDDSQNTISIYLNSTLENSSFSQNWNNASNSTTIGGLRGCNTNGVFNSHNGSLDDIGIWNRALTAEEVQQLYTLNACTFTVYDTVTVENVVTVYDTVLTTVTDTLIINTLITELAPPANTNTIKVFPNPAGSILTIDYGNYALMNGYQLRIENSLGQEVFQTNINQQSDTLSLGSWGGNGLYFVHIVDPQGNTVDIRKIVLQ